MARAMPSVPERRLPPGVPVPTGHELLVLVLAWGQKMLAAETHAQYLERREQFIYLLTIAEKDAYCAPILISHVQSILDEESRIFHSA